MVDRQCNAEESRAAGGAGRGDRSLVTPTRPLGASERSQAVTQRTGRATRPHRHKPETGRGIATALKECGREVQERALGGRWEVGCVASADEINHSNF